MKRRVLAFGALVLALTPARAAHATDIVAARASAGVGLLPDSWRFSAGAGGSFEVNVAPDVVGLRLALDATIMGWISEGPTGNVLGLRPELAVFSGPDAASLRLYGTVRPTIGLTGWNGAEASFFQALEIGPEIEWRSVERSALKIRLGAFYAPAREPEGSFEWGGASVALTVEYGAPTTRSVDVPSDCVPLPTRPCPVTSP